MQVIAALLVLFMAGQSTTSTPAFGGIWILDASRSVLYDGGQKDFQLNVVDAGRTVTVVETRRSAESRYSCSTDGTPAEQREGTSSIYVRSLQRQANALVWRIKMTRLGDQASIEFTERWSLSDEGRTLTIHRVYPGPREVVQVFARKTTGATKNPK